jgi:hypothetical protein
MLVQARSLSLEGRELATIKCMPSGLQLMSKLYVELLNVLEVRGN